MAPRGGTSAQTKFMLSREEAPTLDFVPHSLPPHSPLALVLGALGATSSAPPRGAPPGRPSHAGAAAARTQPPAPMFAVKVGDLNDFIAPSQACVVNLDGSAKATAAAQVRERRAACTARCADHHHPSPSPPPQPRCCCVAQAGEVQVQARGFPQAYAAPSAAAGADASALKVSLHDCLACSGCVTSAETVLLQQQSSDELLAQLGDPAVAVAVSLAPQCVAALAALHRLPPPDCAARLATFLRGLGARAVLDVSEARDLALVEAAEEFVGRFRASARGAQALAAVEAAAAANSDGACAMEVDVGGSAAPAAAAAAAAGGGASAPPPLPLLASACPGWVCYAEKTHGDHVLPYMATTKSPQAVMGTLLKRRWVQGDGEGSGGSSDGGSGGSSDGGSGGRGGAQLVLAPGQRLYHCAVMPCYDKKLEAAREDLMLPGEALGCRARATAAAAAAAVPAFLQPCAPPERLLTPGPPACSPSRCRHAGAGDRLRAGSSRGAGSAGGQGGGAGGAAAHAAGLAAHPGRQRQQQQRQRGRGRRQLRPPRGRRQRRVHGLCVQGGGAAAVWPRAAARRAPAAQAWAQPWCVHMASAAVSCGGAAIGRPPLYHVTSSLVSRDKPPLYHVTSLPCIT